MEEERNPFFIRTTPDEKILSHVSIISDLMDRIPYGRTHHHLIFVMLIVHGCFGLSFTADALGLSTLQNVYAPITDIQSGSLVSAIAVGLAVMSPISGLLADSLGRKKLIMVGISVSFLANVLKPFVATFQWQIAIRIFQGAACSMVWIPSPVLIAEQLPIRVRGPLTLLYQVGWPLFSGISGLLGWWLLSDARNGWLLEGWQWFFFVTSLPFVVALVLVHNFVYESPRYHVGVGNHKEARNVIVEMYAKNGKIRPMELTVVNWCSSSGSGGESSGNRQSLNERGGGVSLLFSFLLLLHLLHLLLLFVVIVLSHLFVVSTVLQQRIFVALCRLDLIRWCDMGCIVLDDNVH